MVKPTLWAGLEIGATRDQVKATFPDVWERGHSLVFDFEMFDCDFEAAQRFL